MVCDIDGSVKNILLIFGSLSDGTVSLEDKGMDEDSDIESDDDMFGLLTQDYIVDKQEVPNIEDLDESIVPILAHKDSRNEIFNLKVVWKV